jgi:hypothetical protein
MYKTFMSSELEGNYLKENQKVTWKDIIRKMKKNNRT